MKQVTTENAIAILEYARDKVPSPESMPAQPDHWYCAVRAIGHSDAFRYATYEPPTSSMPLAQSLQEDHRSHMPSPIRSWTDDLLTSCREEISLAIASDALPHSDSLDCKERHPLYIAQVTRHVLYYLAFIPGCQRAYNDYPFLAALSNESTDWKPWTPPEPNVATRPGAWLEITSAIAACAAYLSSLPFCSRSPNTLNNVPGYDPQKPSRSSDKLVQWMALTSASPIQSFLAYTAFTLHYPLLPPEQHMHLDPTALYPDTRKATQVIRPLIEQMTKIMNPRSE